jgi:L-asparaginase
VASSVSSAIDDVVKRLNIPVVSSFRSANGEVPSSDAGGSNIPSGYLNPQKSRILLGLMLAQGKNFTEIRGRFLGSTDD